MGDAAIKEGGGQPRVADRRRARSGDHAEMTPGPTAINSATSSARVAGIAGVVVATLGMFCRAHHHGDPRPALREVAKQTLLKRILEGCVPGRRGDFTAGLGLLQLALGSFTAPDLFALVVFVLSFLILNSTRIKIGPIALLALGAGVGIGHAILL